MASGHASSYAAQVLIYLLLACGPQPECNVVPVGDCDDVQHCTYEGTEYWQIGDEAGKSCSDPSCETAFEVVLAECMEGFEDADCRVFEIGDCTTALTCCNADGCFYEYEDTFYECDGFDCADAQQALGEECGVETEEDAFGTSSP